MIPIVVGGQMDKQTIAGLIEKLGGGKFAVSIKSDIEGAMAIKSGEAKYYVGACATGAGGALGLAVGLLGPALCVSISTPGRVMKEQEIREQVRNGKRAFGFVNNHAEQLLPILLDEIIKQES